MQVKKIDAILLSRMFLAGARNLDKNKDFINELNVFPVPDGDTGTNMTMTIMSAVKEVSAQQNINMQTLAKAVSTGSLRGARGNSGVILSQLCRGFMKSVAEENDLDAIAIANACGRAVDTAYKAVMRPKEGTILTVAKGISDKAQELAPNADDLEVFLKDVLKYGDQVLDMTPDMLPVLKEAGVVDSGGKGLMEFLSGAFAELTGGNGDSVTSDVDSQDEFSSLLESAIPTEVNISEEDIKFGYCTEFIVMLEKKFSDDDETAVKEFLSGIGDSIVCVADDDIVKIHVHTNDPGLAIQKGLEFGQLSKIKIDNMREEHQERVFKEQMRQALAQSEEEARLAKEAALGPRKKYGFIGISIGDGFNELFQALGCDMIISGGQTMNPSTDDILHAIDQINADHIFILPNNKNIVLAANQAKELTEDKDIIVIPTATIPQGITAFLCFDPENDETSNTEAMLDGIKTVHTGEITYAVRNTKIEGHKIRKGDYMGIADGEILSNGTDIVDVLMEMLHDMTEECSMITVYYGEDVTGAEAEKIESLLQTEFPGYEISVNYGGQPIYYYIVAVE